MTSEGGPGPFLPMPSSPSTLLAPPSPPPPSLSVLLPSPDNPSPTMAFVAVDGDALKPWTQDEHSLIIDIRPPAPYSTSRIPTSLSLSVPSTLLRRPLFSLEKLAEMISSPRERSRFLAWPKASRILVYDADGPGNFEPSNLQALLRKFRNSGFTGELAWLKGGFNSVFNQYPALVDLTPLSSEGDMDEAEDSSPSSLLRPQRLSTAAFSLSSTIAAATPALVANLRLHQRRPTMLSLPPSASGKGMLTAPMALPMTISLPPSECTNSGNSQKTAFNPFFDAIRQNLELSHGITEHIPLRLPSRVRQRVHELPALWLQSIARRAGPASPPSHDFDCAAECATGPIVLDVRLGKNSTPSSDSELMEEGAEKLASQFYRIELAEQKRLLDVMEHHSKDCGPMAKMESAAEPSFPFSIAAGLEKGLKNRYRHIWPFEHARVRLSTKSSTDDDYVNASYVQPLGTRRRYIATQGPLQATFVDFWRLCWEQNVHVVVMLTNESEGPVVKCGCYWTGTTYGPLRLKLLATLESTTSKSDANSFTFAAPRGTTIKRVFELSHANYPTAGTRTVIQLQYLDWPDLNVPDNPQGVLGLVKDLDIAVRETGGIWGDCDQLNKPSRQPTFSLNKLKFDINPSTGIVNHALNQNAPVLLHCSAGVGRTGGFIAVDAVLDGVRREVRKRAFAESQFPSRTTPPKNRVFTNKACSPPPSLPLPGPNDSSVMSMHSRLNLIHGDEQSTGAQQVISTKKHYYEQADVDVRNRGRRDVNPEPPTRYCVRSASPHLSPGGPVPSPHTPLSTGRPSHSARSSPSPCRAVPLSLPRQPPIRNVPATLSCTISSEESSYDSSSDHPAKSSPLYTSMSSVDDVKDTASPQRTQSWPTLRFPPPNDFSNSQLSVPARQPLSEGDMKMDVDSSDVPGMSIDESTNHPGMGISTNILPLAGGHKVLVKVSQENPAGAVKGQMHARHEQKNLQSIEIEGSYYQGTGRRANPLVSRFPGFILSGNSNNSETHSLLNETLANAVAQAPCINIDEKNSPKSWPSSTAPPDSLPPSDAGSPDSQTRSLSTPDRQTSASRSPLGRLKSSGYKEPRRLHTDSSPTLLSSFENPIWEVVQDLREQRMSLCQSLRQYVFVHAAVIEGALMILDEERERQHRRQELKQNTMVELVLAVPATKNNLPSTDAIPATSDINIQTEPALNHGLEPHTAALAAANEGSQQQTLFHASPSIKTSLALPLVPLAPQPVRPSLPPLSPSYFERSRSIGKRSASPTELVKEGRSGEPLLSKRPSIKRDHDAERRSL